MVAPFAIFALVITSYSIHYTKLYETVKPFDFSTSPWAAKIVVAFIQFWQWYGYTTIILISGVLGINPELFEAAEIDGASPRQTFFQITLPCMRTILIFTLITSYNFV